MITITDFITPVYLIILYGLAVVIRPRVTNKDTKRFFIPGLTLKFVGSLAFAVIFTTYYGGDTSNYYFHSSALYNAAFSEPGIFFKYIFKSGDVDQEMLEFAWGHGMWWYNDGAEFFVVKVAALFSLLCFNSFFVISLLFACLSFSGLWALYLVFYKRFPELKKQFAIAVFFIPSSFFWGSGLMKDSLCVGAVGWLVYGLYNIFIVKKYITKSLIITLIAAWALMVMKIYILLCLLPAMVFWIFMEFNSKISSKAARTALKPVFLIVGVGAAFLLMTSLSAGNKKYDIEMIGKTAKTTADYLYSQSVQQEGSAYSIGELDGSLGSMIKLAPQAIVVSLFRPFIWEVRNPVMLLSALESMWFTFLTLAIFYKAGFGKSLKAIGSSPIVSFCFIFSLVFAFAVGVTSFNFGTLVRYKIPLIPFYVAGLFMLKDIHKTARTGKYKRKRSLA